MLRHYRSNQIAANPPPTHLRSAQRSILSVVLAHLLLGHLHDAKIWEGEHVAWTDQENLCQESRS